MRNVNNLASLGFVVALSACASGARDPAAMTSATSVSLAEMEANRVSDNSDYRIGPSDLLRLSVFQVPDLSFDELRVDAAGNIQMPLLGQIPAAGKTPTELADVLTAQLSRRFLQNPQVSIVVTEAASQKVTIDGAVTKPGVYAMRGRTSLLQAVAMAEGPSRTANMKSIAVFRKGAQGRMVAIYDLAAIRNGSQEDPVILGDDVIVVDTSRLSRTMQDVLQALPGLAVFAYF